MKLFYPDNTSYYDITIFFILIYCLVVFFAFLVIKNYFKNINYISVLLISLIISGIIMFLNHGGLFLGF